MGKYFEALERAEKAYGRRAPEAPLKPIAETPPPISPSEATHEPMDCYEALKTNILSHHPGQTIKTILFLGTTHGDGASTTAINFATTLARSFRLKVLLIEANLRTPGVHTAFRIEPERGLSDIMSNGDKPDFYIKKVKSGNLSVVTAGSKLTEAVSLFESDRFNEFLTSVRVAFDYIILDGPPITSFSEARVLCTKVDGVVIVIEAGKTREQVAVRAKKELEEAGGKVLGVVLNKRKFYIPEWIYKRL
ncbi:MAG: CpsD/CapB family tyrosine-protein kinase [Desulfobacterales bacterium]|jgi:capsular exopolysaccharide synthesis family protein